MPRLFACALLLVLVAGCRRSVLDPETGAWTGEATASRPCPPPTPRTQTTRRPTTPLQPSPETLGLGEIRGRILERANLTVAAEAYRNAEARGRITQAAQPPNPYVLLRQRRISNFELANSGFGELEVGMPIELGHKRSARVRQAMAEAAAVSEGVRVVTANTLRDAELAFYRALRIHGEPRGGPRPGPGRGRAPGPRRDPLPRGQGQPRAGPSLLGGGGRRHLGRRGSRAAVRARVPLAGRVGRRSVGIDTRRRGDLGASRAVGLRPAGSRAGPGAPPAAAGRGPGRRGRGSRRGARRCGRVAEHRRGHRRASTTSTWIATTSASRCSCPVPLFDRNEGNRALSRAAARRAHTEVQAEALRLNVELDQAVIGYERASRNAQGYETDILPHAAGVARPGRAGVQGRTIDVPRRARRPADALPGAADAHPAPRRARPGRSRRPLPDRGVLRGHGRSIGTRRR